MYNEVYEKNKYIKVKINGLFQEFKSTSADGIFCNSF